MSREQDHIAEPEERLDQLLAEYYQGIEAGKAFDQWAFVASHPDFADELREFFADKERFDRAAESLAPCPPAGSSRGENAALEGGPGNPSEVPPTMDASLPRAPIATRAARRLGNYELLEEVACGGMGIVYRSRQCGLNRIVAVKMILSAQLASRTDVERFRREAEAAGNLRHRNIVKIHEVGEQDGLHFFSMDFIEGKSLAAMVRKGPLPAEQAARYVKKVAEAIHYAHQQGILHRDLKPANVLVDQDDEPVVTDFGLAKRMKADSQLTGSGDVLGTPSYMSPEQATGSTEIGPASDVYGLGAILYELLTGRAPFRGETPGDTLLDVLATEPAAPRTLKPKLPRDLETIVLKCLEKEQTRRYPTAAALAEDLDRFLEGKPIGARPVSFVRKSLHWIHGVPLVAALTGRTLNKPTAGQKRAQLAIPLLAVLIVAAVFLWPKNYRILANEGGTARSSDGIARWLAAELESRLGRRVRTVHTGGSNQNIKNLRDHDLALTHSYAEQLKDGKAVIVAPLYHGVIYALVRENSKINSIAECKRKKIAVGPESLGMRDAAVQMLWAHGIKLGDLIQATIDETLDEVLRDEEMDGAIITTGQDHPDLEGVFARGFKALSLDQGAVNTLIGQGFRRVDLPVGKEATITTVSSPVVLVAKPGAPDRLVIATLDSLYSPAEEPPFHFLMGREEAESFVSRQSNLVHVHRAARKVFGATSKGPRSP